jgi:hypothetical protein
MPFSTWGDKVTTEREVAGPVRPLQVRRFGRRVYQITAVLCLVAAVQAVIVGAVGPSRRLGFAAAVLLAGGAITLIVKSIPHEHVRFGGR